MGITYIKLSGKIITLDEDALDSLFSTTQIFIHILERFYPDVYEEMLQAFDDAAEINPEFKTDRDLFVTTMCQEDCDRKDAKQNEETVNFEENKKKEGNAYGSENHHSFGKIRKIHG